MIRVRSKIENAVEPIGYEDDFHAWTEAQAAALQAGRWGALDIDNLVDEVLTLGRSERREIASRLRILLMHLLKWRTQPDRRSTSWQATIVEQRKTIASALRDSPSLRSWPQQILADEYETARLKAAGETGLALDRFPVVCPFTMEEILDLGTYPEDEDD